MAMPRKGSLSGASSIISAPPEWNESLLPKKHKDGCKFNEEAFQIRMKETLFTPQKLVDQLEATNSTLERAYNKSKKKKSAFRPEYKNTNKILDNPFVLQYLEEQRKMLSEDRSEHYTLCECAFPEDRKTESLKRTGETSKKIKKKSKVLAEKPRTGLLVKTDAEITEFDVQMAHLAMAPQSPLDVFPIVFGKRNLPVETAVREEIEEEVDKPAPTSANEEEEEIVEKGNNSRASSVYSIEELVNSGGIRKDEVEFLFGEISSDDDESKGVGGSSQEIGEQMMDTN